jgi:hypothetical protein
MDPRPSAPRSPATASLPTKCRAKSAPERRKDPLPSAPKARACSSHHHERWIEKKTPRVSLSLRVSLHLWLCGGARLLACTPNVARRRQGLLTLVALAVHGSPRLTCPKFSVTVNFHFPPWLAFFQKTDFAVVQRRGYRGLSVLGEKVGVSAVGDRASRDLLMGHEQVRSLCVS